MRDFAFPARMSVKRELGLDECRPGLEIFSRKELVGYEGVAYIGKSRFDNGSKSHYYVHDGNPSPEALMEDAGIEGLNADSLINHLNGETVQVPYRRPLIMAVANATPDSFYGGSRVDSRNDFLDELIDAKPDIIDIGGESTRPGSLSPGIEEEIRRLKPVIEYIESVSEIPISLDTRHPEVLLRFADSIDYTNDVTGFKNPDMIRISAENSLKCITMHMRGVPENMQSFTDYGDIVPEVISYLYESASQLNEAGVKRGDIIIDPGIGFSKDYIGNIELLHEIRSFSIGFDTLVGASRKSFIGKITGEAPEGRLPGTLAVTAHLALNRVNIIRVHDPKENLQVLKVLQNIVDPGNQL